jgi:drug/metabolite transporter (DMT)-like permease
MVGKIRAKFNNGFWFAVVAAIAGGSIPVAAKISLEVFQPFTVVALRFIFATLFLLPFVYKSKVLSFDLYKKFFIVALIGSLNPILLIVGLPFTNASVPTLIYAGVPALTVLYLYLIQKKKVSRKQIAGLIIGFIGVALIILLPVLNSGDSKSMQALFGNLLIFASAAAFMFYGIVSKKAQVKINASPLALTFYFSVVTLLVSLPLAASELLSSGIPEFIDYSHIFGVIALGVVGTGISYLAYQYALKVGSEIAASLMTYLQPIATILLASLFLEESVSLILVIGGVLAVVGAKIASW